MGIRNAIRKQINPNPVLEKYYLRMRKRPVEVRPPYPLDICIEIALGIRPRSGMWPL